MLVHRWILGVRNSSAGWNHWPSKWKQIKKPHQRLLVCKLIWVTQFRLLNTSLPCQRSKTQIFCNSQQMFPIYLRYLFNPVPSPPSKHQSYIMLWHRGLFNCSWKSHLFPRLTLFPSLFPVGMLLATTSSVPASPACCPATTATSGCSTARPCLASTGSTLLVRGHQFASFSPKIPTPHRPEHWEGGWHMEELLLI